MARRVGPLHHFVVPLPRCAGEEKSPYFAPSVVAIASIFGRDMARPEVIEPIARDLRGLLSGDARAYLAERLRDD